MAVPGSSQEFPNRSGAIQGGKGAIMFLAVLLSRFKRSARFVWSPALDLRDNAIYSTLLPGAQY